MVKRQYKQHLKELGKFSLQKRRFRREMEAIFKRREGKGNEGREEKGSWRRWILQFFCIAPEGENMERRRGREYIY